MTAAAELSKQDLERVRECEQAIGYVFKGPTLLLHALTHASSQNADLPSNERLEFLGDSVLGLAVSEFLFNFLEDGDEGDLTQIKSVVVSTVTLAGESRRLGLDRSYCVGKGMGKRHEMPPSLLANVFEALVGAVHLDGGLDAARAFVVGTFGGEIRRTQATARDAKTRLQEWAHARLHETPTYRTLHDSKIDQDSERFEVEVWIASEAWARGRGRTKRQAEQAAAAQALLRAEETT